MTWEENLLVPNLIGEGCTHKNLKDYIKYREIYVDKAIKE